MQRIFTEVFAVIHVLLIARGHLHQRLVALHWVQMGMGCVHLRLQLRRFVPNPSLHDFHQQERRRFDVAHATRHMQRRAALPIARQQIDVVLEQQRREAVLRVPDSMVQGPSLVQMEQLPIQ